MVVAGVFMEAPRIETKQLDRTNSDIVFYTEQMLRMQSASLHYFVVFIEDDLTNVLQQHILRQHKLQST